MGAPKIDADDGHGGPVLAYTPAVLVLCVAPHELEPLHSLALCNELLLRSCGELLWLDAWDSLLLRY